MKSPNLLPCLIACIFILSTIPSATSSSFNFSSFNPNNDINIEYQGDASPSVSGIDLTLNDRTANPHRSIGRVLFNTSMQLTDFTTNFSFIVNSQGNSSYADGLTFFLAPENFSIPDPSSGGGLGLVSGNEPENPKVKFVAVEFDTYRNDWDPSAYEQHVGINVNSMRSSVSARWCSDIENGALSNATVRYSGRSKILTVEFSGFCSGKNNIEKAIDLKEILPKNIVVGFSAESSNLVQMNILKSWNFTDLSPGDEKNTGLVVGMSLFSCILTAELCMIWIGMYWKKSH